MRAAVIDVVKGSFPHLQFSGFVRQLSAGSARAVAAAARLRLCAHHIDGRNPGGHLSEVLMRSAALQRDRPRQLNSLVVGPLLLVGSLLAIVLKLLEQV